jgi:hypothetical protein
VCDEPSQWGAKETAACSYNANVTLGSKTISVDSCSAEWLYETNRTGVNVTRAPNCYPGSNFMYTHVNDCDYMSSDMRLTNPLGTPAFDKCALEPTTNNDKLVKADDLWSAVVSYQHDPCGWPFVECVPDCSLPSDPTSKSWKVAANGTVLDASNAVVGCTTADCSKVMQDPRDANLIGAM